ncbi:MAG TPA: GNAT family N-acetyltransferase [Bryobacteraceae bacterium]|jgi:GNAT superfamily N-acetyltransferase|nr:GNAT family N-acetyltransferase [Bryobacteraceae bacterium]
MEIVHAETAGQLAQVRALFEEYWASFGFTPCFQNFAEELAGLPGKYVRPGGRLALSLVEGEPAGCAALRRLDGARCEFKRLYVRPGYRGMKLGRVLLAWIVAEAKAAGYRELMCDTMPEMADALAMYERAGFERTAPYTAEPTPGAIFLRLALAS